MNEDTQTLITLMDPLLHLHGYVLRRESELRMIPIGPGDVLEPVLDRDGNITSMSVMSVAYTQESVKTQRIHYWVVQSLGPKTLDIICRSDEELLVTVVSILFPERFIDYMKIAIQLTQDENKQAYYQSRIENWKHYHDK